MPKTCYENRSNTHQPAVYTYFGSGLNNLVQFLECTTANSGYWGKPPCTSVTRREIWRPVLKTNLTNNVRVTDFISPLKYR